MARRADGRQAVCLRQQADPGRRDAVRVCRFLRRGLRQRDTPGGVLRLPANPRLVGAGSISCETGAGPVAPVAAIEELALAPSNDRLARRIANGDQALLAELGLAPRGARPDMARLPELPVLRLGGSGDWGLTGNAPPPLMPSAAAGCRTSA